MLANISKQAECVGCDGARARGANKEEKKCARSVSRQAKGTHTAFRLQIAFNSRIGYCAHYVVYPLVHSLTLIGTDIDKLTGERAIEMLLLSAAAATWCR